MGKYAENTQVPVDQSKAEIEKILNRYGADQFMYATRNDAAMVMFRAHNRLVRFIVPMPDPNSKEFRTTETGRGRSNTAASQAYEQEIRRRWRALVLSIKGKLEAVESGIMSFEEEFMANIVLPDDVTVGELMIPKIEEAYKTGRMPKLLPFFAQE